jgi:hypothetical protein
MNVPKYTKITDIQADVISDSGSEDTATLKSVKKDTPRDLPEAMSLLKQLFCGSEDVKHRAMCQYVLKQKFVGSVVTQSASDSTDDEEVDESGKNKYNDMYCHFL